MPLLQRNRLFWFGVPLLLVVTAIGGASASQSGADEITFGTVRLILGTQERVVLGQLREKYRVVNTSPDNWAVLEDSRRAFGSIAFRGGRLSYVNRTWVQVPHAVTGEIDPVALARAFHAVISQFVKESRFKCTIGTHEGFGAEAEGRTAYIACGGKEVRVAMYRSDPIGWFATVTEVMHAVP